MNSKCAIGSSMGMVFLPEAFQMELIDRHIDPFCPVMFFQDIPVAFQLLIDQPDKVLIMFSPGIVVVNAAGIRAEFSVGPSGDFAPAVKTKSFHESDDCNLLLI